MELVPVDHDPFAGAKPAGPQLVPVDHDPFAIDARRDAPAAGMAGDASAAMGRGIINGVPVVGPYLLGGVNRGVAAIRSLQNDTRYSDELAKVQRFGEATATEHPWATTGGEIAGGVVGTAPLVAAAPAAFGVGGAALPARMAASGASGGLLGGADAAVRSDGDGRATAIGGGLGLSLGLAGPGLGKVAGKAVSALTGGGKGQSAVREALEGVSEKDLTSARFLIEQARALPGGGVPLTLDEALNAASGGQAGRASQLARVVANSGGEGGRIMREFYAARPASVDNVGRSAFEGIAPQSLDLTGVGFDIRDAARAGVAQTPEGLAFGFARAGQLPRITPEQAGQAIQSDLGGVRSLREAARAARANVDYAIARDAPERFGFERMVTVERPGEPIVTQPQFSRPQFGADAPAPLGPRPLSSDGAEAGSRAQSLLDYLAKNGGVPLDAEARAGDLNKFYRPGSGTLARHNAPTWDQIRVRLAEQGFLPPGSDGYASAAGVRDTVLDALHQERIGRGRMVRMGEDAEAGMARRGDFADEYSAALGSAERSLDENLSRFGVDPESLHPEVRSRTVNAMMGDDRLDALDAYERVVGSMREPPRPYSRSTTVTEEIPDVRFAQVDPRPAVGAIDDLLRTAKGDVASVLQGARRNLYAGGDNGLPDLTVAGNLRSRERLDADIAAAEALGDSTKVRDLTLARRGIDRQLKAVPEVATADANFARNSVPLEPFERANAPLNRITGRVDRPGAEPGPFRMPAEQVPGVLAGPTALREALANGSPATRAAAERHASTRILESATGADGNVSADALRMAMREHADVLDQLPSVRDRLGNLVVAREGLARVEGSPLGQLATQAPEVEHAVRMLFPLKPGANTHVELASAMQAVARNRPTAARDLARYYLETVFNEATQQVKGIAAQYGGAGFASAIRGNAQQRHNLEAVIRALPEGDMRWAALDRMLTTLEATGWRPQKGSDTAFNIAIQKRLETGKGPLAAAVTDAAVGGIAGASVGGPGGLIGGAAVGAKRGGSSAWAERQRDINGEAIARIFTDPLALPDIRSLSKAPAGSRNAELFTQRLLTLANGGASPARGSAAAR